jgi:hypothetical protein
MTSPKIRILAAGLAIAMVAGMAKPGYSRPADATTEWDVVGHHSAKGQYKGTARIVEAADGQLTIDVAATFTSGEKLTWHGQGHEARRRPGSSPRSRETPARSSAAGAAPTSSAST